MDIRFRFLIGALLLFCCIGLLAIAESVARTGGTTTSLLLFGSGAAAGLIAIAFFAWK
jgi:hypothetical protein